MGQEVGDGEDADGPADGADLRLLDQIVQGVDPLHLVAHYFSSTRI